MAGDIETEIHEWAEETLRYHVGSGLRERIARDTWLPAVLEEIGEDLSRCTEEDAASLGDRHFVFAPGGAMEAIATYRLAHALIHRGEMIGEVERMRRVAIGMANMAKSQTMVEIHPEAEIGPRLRVDHGAATVIGQEVRIGADCTLLQTVILGAQSANAGESRVDADGRRHPKLGDGVMIYGNVSIIGPVTIGDGALIGEGCTIRSDVPAGLQVHVVNQVQVRVGDEIDVCGLRPSYPNELEVLGSGLLDVEASFLDSKHEVLDAVQCTVSPDADGRRLRLEISISEANASVPSPPRLRVARGEEEAIVLESQALRTLWKNCPTISREPVVL